MLPGVTEGHHCCNTRNTKSSNIHKPVLAVFSRKNKLRKKNSFQATWHPTTALVVLEINHKAPAILSHRGKHFQLVTLSCEGERVAAAVCLKFSQKFTVVYETRRPRSFRCSLLRHESHSFLPALACIFTRKNVGHFALPPQKIQGHVSASSAHPSLGNVAQGRENSWDAFSVTCALPVVR